MPIKWNQLFLKKEEWQQNTFESIKKDLFSARDNHFINYNNAKENHFVMIYGKSQVGKTTLILNMIGLKSDCVSKVYDTLRAGVPRGNSSTSTAIIYTKSINEQYGCILTSINDISSKDIKYFDKKGIIHHLEDIRKHVENNKVSSDKILFIYIPKNYFIQDSTTDNISIMDMPGIESRNYKETFHVQNLMTKYIPISSICIITCRSNNIQSLETLALPNSLDWKRMSHRFILVITHAYNDGSIKQYFKKNPSERETNFYDYVIKTYTQEIRKILGDTNKTEVYPVDVGDTFEKLCSTEIKKEVDKKEIINTHDRVLSEIRESIKSRKGDKLKAALNDLDILIQHYGEDELQDISKKIKEHNSTIVRKEASIKNMEKDIKELSSEDSEQNEISSEIENLKAIKTEFYSLKHKLISNLSDETNQFAMKKGLYERDNNGYYLKDKEKKLLENIRKNIYNSVFNIIEGKIKNLIKKANIDIKIDKSKIQNEAEKCILQKEEKFYPKKNIIDYITFGYTSTKIYKDKIEKICESIQNNINKKVIANYIESYISEIDKSIIKNKNEIKHIEKIISNNKRKCEKYKKVISDCKKEIENLKNEEKNIRQEREQDKQTRAKYLKYAKDVYSHQRKDIINKINSSKNADDKLLLILFLGLLDKDYHKVIKK